LSSSLLFDEEFDDELLLEFEDEFELEFELELLLELEFELLLEFELELELLFEFEFELEFELLFEFELLLLFESELLFEFELPFDRCPSLWLPWWRKRNSVSPLSSSSWKSWKKRWIGSPEGCPLCAFAAAAVEVISEATRIRFTSFICPFLPLWWALSGDRALWCARTVSGPPERGVGGFGVRGTIRRSSHLAIN
jgi:hypothetical protein